MTARHDRFVADVESGPIVDNAGHLTVVGALEADRCPICGDPIPGDIDQCDPCAEALRIRRAMRMDRYDPSPHGIDRSVR